MLQDFFIFVVPEAFNREGKLNIKDNTEKNNGEQ